MKTILKNANVYKFGKNDIAIENGIIAEISPFIDALNGDVVFDLNNKYIFPGFVDVHVHFREPGFSYKETIKTGSRAAAAGGFTHVCTMPNLNPVPDSYENLMQQKKIIDKDALINVYPFGAITKGQKGTELAGLEDMAKDVIGFSDDGRGVQDSDMMERAMNIAKKYNQIISAHCEDNSLLDGGYIHKGEYAKLNGHDGICSESEWKPIERDIELAHKTGVKYHVCHISAKESVELIRNAKRAGVDITCETAPHYLIFDDSMLIDSGNFKMNPPIRAKEDRQALIDGVCDGTVDMIATDHAPHSKEEKSGGLKGSLNGIVGIETSFSVLYTKLVKTGIISINRLIELMSISPAKRFGISCNLNVGEKANLNVFDLDKKYVVNPSEFYSMGKSTPFDGMELFGKCIMTVCNGNVVHNLIEEI